MKRKLLACLLSAAMVVSLLPTAAFAEGTDEEQPSAVEQTAQAEADTETAEAPQTTYVAETEDGTQFETLAEAVNAAESGSTITLTDDIDVAQTLVITKELTLDLDGHTLSNSDDIWAKGGKNDWSLISVRENGDLTITGSGKLAAKENDCYAVDVQGDNAAVTIENGTFIGDIHAVYVEIGVAYIQGGTYSIQQTYPNADRAYEFVLNLYDENRANGTAKMFVTGGTFVNFDPANCKAEGEGTNFCEDGYVSIQNGNTYTVKSLEEAAVAQSGEKLYLSIADALADGAADIKLLQNTAEDVVIPPDKTTVLDLNDKTLTNAKGHTITNNGTLTINGGGTVDNVSHQKAAVLNNVGGTVTINGGSYTRSAEASTSDKNSGNNSYYVIENQGTMTIADGTFKFSDANTGLFSSLIHNGWYDGSKNTNKVESVLNISGGSFTGGVITLKNDDYGSVAMTAGTFTQPVSNYWCIYNFNKASISGGTVYGNIAAAYISGGADEGKLNISNLFMLNGHVKAANEGAQIAILGGYFTTDPSAYFGPNKALVASDKAGYAYKVGDRAQDIDVDTAVAAGEPTVTVPTDIQLTADDVKEAAAKSASDLTEAAASAGMTNDDKVVGDRKDAADALTKASVTVTESTDITVFVQPYLDVAVKSADKEKNTLTLDISAKYNVVATTADNADDIKLPTDNEGAANAVIVKEAQPMTVTTPVDITIALPDGFPVPSDKTIYVQHFKDDNKTTTPNYIYEAKVSEDGKTAVFTNPNGFSTFVVTSTAAAKIGDTYYAALADAVAAVKNGETIVLLADNDETVTVDRTVKFTLDKGEFQFNGEVKAGSNTTVKNENGEYEFTYTAPSGGGGGGGSSSTQSKPAVSFDDVVSGSWYAEAVNYVVDKGLMSGTAPRTFAPDAQTTRAMMWTVLARLDGQDVSGASPWYDKAMTWATQSGVSDGTMPEVNITREQLATMLYSYAKLKGLEVIPNGMSLSKFSDADSISPWASEAVSWAAYSGILSGRSDGTVDPTARATRAEMSVMLMQFAKLLEK